MKYHDNPSNPSSCREYRQISIEVGRTNTRCPCENDRGHTPPGGNRPQFAIGDRVKCIEPGSRYLYNRIGIVTHYIPSELGKYRVYIADFGVGNKQDLGTLFEKDLQLV